MKRRLSTTIVLFAVAFILMAGIEVSAQFGQPKILLNLRDEKEVLVRRNGKIIPERIPAEEVQRGDTLIYTISYKNDGAAEAREAAFVGPIPDGTVYVMEEGTTEETTDVLYSINGGLSYEKPPITYREAVSDGSMVEKVAPPEMYTHVKWLMKDPIPPGSTGEVSYKVKVN